MAEPTTFDTFQFLFSNDDLVVDLPPISPSADLHEIRQYVENLDSWKRVREQLSAGGLLAKMVTFRDLIKLGLLDLSDASILRPPDDTGGDGGSGYHLSLPDLTSDLEPNPYAGFFRPSGTFVVQGVRAHLLTASTSGSVVITGTVNGAALFSTNITIEVNEKTSADAATQPALAISTIPANAEVIFEIVNAGASARGLEVALWGVES